MSRAIRYAPFLVFFAAMLWATDAPFRLHLTESLSSNFIVLGEHFFDVLVVLPVLFTSRLAIRRLTYCEWAAIIVIAVGGSALASVAFTEAFRYVNPSVAILLQKLQPLIAIGLAGPLLKETRSRRFWLFAAVALFGAYLISFPGLWPQTYAGEAWNPNIVGVLLALGAAALWGASTVLGKYVLAAADFKLMTALRFAVAFLFLLLLNWQQHSFPAFGALTGTDILFIAIIAMVSGAVSLFIYYKGLTHTKASVATLAELGFPLAAVVVNWIFLGDSLSPMQLLGMAVLLVAVFHLAKTDRAAVATEALGDAHGF
ncbi:MAG: DMT family transporter [Patescibacteria group bacterium]|nr:DMT family transporter [Patescibacteria group bacterium]MDE1966339.1 DMT family transporter [Patescibacteria group bacterium]